MQYTSSYNSPLGDILISADEAGLTGLWFDRQKYYALSLKKESEIRNEESLPVFEQVKRWLDIYFSGKEPDFMPPLHFIGSKFQIDVWKILCDIPYGQTITYGDIAMQIARQRNIQKMSAQAVGGAVGRNNISIIVPCHRVMGANGNLTGYASGIDKKIALLKYEGAYKDTFFIPKRSTAP